MTDLPMAIASKLSSPLAIDIYGSQAQAMISGKKCSILNINKGASMPIFLTAPNVNEKYTKHAGVGQYLQGITLFTNVQQKLSKKKCGSKYTYLMSVWVIYKVC